MAFVDRYLPALLTQAAHQLVGSFTDVVRSHRLSVLEWRVLATLADNDAMSVGQLARHAATKQPTLTRLLVRMAQQGHVERGEHGKDRRLTLVRVTPTGRALAWKLMEQAEAQQRTALQSFGPERLQQLEELLRLLIDQHGTSADVAGSLV
ncbi:MarR family winged helix-turn-helix transcriptional regulator [Azohydromonas lata]|uniref:MarR family transcriptional regulator n=1 Tax=Azohydromonas lata TaxID=45677 RepID=A0ABU5IRH2_9BURK|nr:MarR family transcriptional regulator [Azohydromonas lata]MDZ5461475.1 MarR family transcriptional regulator [Azohydromonas lata]